MRTIRYQRHEFTWPRPQRRHAELSVLVYDIPYFAACGVFPPLQVCNQIFASGGSQGGMSPGATWKPFEIDAQEYAELVETIRSLEPRTLADKARYTHHAFAFDPGFDHIADHLEWASASAKNTAKPFIADCTAPQTESNAKRRRTARVLLVRPRNFGRISPQDRR
ncbi:hypothetical protein [Tahibacter caeni]|uniref:hypothetical protein n=1 Tax=Tahibacter caeni TaxID=1453545 RepID=UPI00214977EF|nr:hypothetical protein [Tahibacter caeni]